MKNRYFIFSFFLLCAFSFSILPLAAQDNSLEEIEYASGVAPKLLDQLNEPYDGSGYPWLSADGLRLYYNSANGMDQFFYATRTSRHDNFGDPSHVIIETENDVLSCWLTADELQMWYVERTENFGLSTTVKRASRFSATDDFVEIESIKVDVEDGFVSGPTLTRDGQEMYLYNAPDYGASKLFKLRQTSDLSYEVEKEITFGQYQVAGSAQLSKDDLRLYVSLEGADGQEHIYVAERTSATAEFDTKNLKKLASGINVNSPKSFQPTVSGDETEMVFTRNPDGMWGGNKLWFAKIDLVEAEEVDSDEEQLVVEEPAEEEAYASLDDFVVDEEWEEELLDDEMVWEELTEEDEILVNVLIEEAPEAKTEEVADEADALAIPEVALVYPNPSNGVFNFEIKLSTEVSNPMLEVYSMDGTKHGSWEVDQQKTTHTIDLSYLTAGTYLYRLVSEQGMSDSGKLILVR